MANLKYLSVCSGIDAASVAWKDLPWKAVGFSEINKFCNQVLKYHYPETPNFGDLTQLHESENYQSAQFDVLIGGTPCQAFSLAGNRTGLDDDRSNLALEYCRVLGSKQPKWFIWENVPGCTSTAGGEDFACLLSAWTGRSVSGQQFTNAGVIQGAPGHYSIAWRILDAQYFGVPQRRRRIFVVGHLGDDWRPPVSVLFESQSLCRIAQKGQKTQCQDTAFFETGFGSWSEGVGTLRAQGGNNGPGSETLIISATVTSKWAKGGGPSGDEMQNLVPVFHPVNDVSPTLTSQNRNGGGGNGRFGENVDTVKSLVMHQTGRLRRLTPLECERLQGFPDNYTLIPIGKSKKLASDTPRYVALGNSMAVPVIKWLGERINQCEDLLKQIGL